MQKKILFAVRLPEELKMQLDKIAVEKRRKTSDLVRIILEDFVEQQGHL
ncbi:MAG: DNA-binding protein [Clostridia bacterium]|nr:DNA-binding protein [Clostridia bacterium]MBR5226459.1 DNA-binding protein [Clostridia bacterium]